MFELAKVTVRFGDRRVLDSVSGSLGPKPVAVMGPSGSGKTTLLRVLAGQLRPNTGAVSFAGRAVTYSRSRTTDSRVAMIHQDYRLVEFLSVLDNVLLASELRGMGADESDAQGVLERVGLTAAVADRRPGTLSGGEQQRVAIARALLCGADVLLADEPTGALDIGMTAQITDLLLELAASDAVQVVVATHDPAVASRMPQRVMVSDGCLKTMPADG